MVSTDILVSVFQWINHTVIPGSGFDRSPRGSTRNGIPVSVDTFVQCQRAVLFPHHAGTATFQLSEIRTHACHSKTS